MERVFLNFFPPSSHANLIQADNHQSDGARYAENQVVDPCQMWGRYFCRQSVFRPIFRSAQSRPKATRRPERRPHVEY
jgi:hypothetical protein